MIDLGSVSTFLAISPMLAYARRLNLSVGKAAFTSIVLGFVLLQPLRAQAFGVDEFDISSDYEMDRRFDWTITVKTIARPNILNYPTSSLKSMSKLAVRYRLTPRLNPDPAAKSVDYEDLWYHEARAIGCRRYHSLDLPFGYQGAIRIEPSADANGASGAIANAIARLFLDVGVRKCLVTVAFVPKDIFGEVQDQLGNLGFSNPGGTDLGAGAIPLYLFSNPKQVVSTLYLHGR